MALTGITTEFYPFRNQPGGREKAKMLAVVTFSFAANYTAGGETFTPEMFGLDTLDVAAFEELWLTDTTYSHLKYDRTNGQVLAYNADTAADTEGEASGDISARVYRALLFGDVVTESSL